MNQNEQSKNQTKYTKQQAQLTSYKIRKNVFIAASKPLNHEAVALRKHRKEERKKESETVAAAAARMPPNPFNWL